MYKPQFPLITVVWLLLTVVMLGLTIGADINRIHKRLTNNAHYVYSSIYEKTYLNEVLLQNFTALVSANPDDLGTIHSFANDMRKRYPNIIRLQIQQQAATGTGQQMITQTGTEDPATPNSTSMAFDNAHFPISFVEPLNADTRHLLGDDLLQDVLFTNTLNYARRYHQPVASLPFTLEDGSQAYALFLAFYDRNNAPTEHNLYIASLIIDTASLLPNASFLNQGAAVIMRSEQGTVLDQRAAPGAQPDGANWLPRLENQRTIKRFGQSFQVDTVQQVGLDNLSLGTLLAILAAAAGSYLLIIAYLRQKLSAKEEHSKLVATLRHEQHQLEERIQRRTRELHDQLLENRRLTHQVLAVQEKERRNLSRELHDELGQSLTAIRTDAKILKRIHPEEHSLVYQASESIDAIAQHIYDVTYGMMRTLRPAALDDLGLLDALQECIISQRFAEHNITLHSNFRGALNDMSEDYNITLFRLTQEAFSNIIHHAEAANVWIDIHRLASGQRKDIAGDRIELMISDDGNGFDIDSIAFKRGFGLIGMRERVRALGGVFQIQQNHDSGIRISAVIPIAAAYSTAAAVAPKSDQAAPAELVH